MFLIDHAPHVASHARTLGKHLRVAVPVLYEVLLQPVPENQAVYRAMSDLIRRLKHRSSAERQIMLEYTASLLLGDGSVPRGMDRALASYTEAQLFAQRYHYRHMHPIRTRLQAAA